MSFEFLPQVAGGLPEVPVGAQIAPDLPGGGAMPEATDTSVSDMTRPGDGQAIFETPADDQPDMTRPPIAQEGNGDLPVTNDSGAGHTDESAGTSQADNPGTDAGGGTPPDVPGTHEIDTPDPDRGAALQRLCDYAAVSADEVHDTVIDHVTSSDIGQAMISGLTQENGRSLNEAVRDIARVEDDDGTTLESMVVDTKRNVVETQHHADLAAAGLSAISGQDRVELRLTDAPAFAAALRAVPIADDPEAHVRLVQQSSAVVKEALYTASTIAITSNTTIVRGAIGDETAPRVIGLAADHYAATPAPEAEAAAALADHADTIARDLNRLHAPESTVYAARQLALARQEGQVAEWAVAHGALRLIGQSGSVMGVDRYTTADSWEPAYRFLNYLQHSAPDMALTAEVASTITEELRTAIAGQDTAPPLQDRGVTPAMQQRWREIRQQLLAEARPQLEAALRRVTEITGWG